MTDENDDEIMMIQGVCRHFWRKRNNIPRHGPIMVSPTEIQMPTFGAFCSACVKKINESDPTFVVKLALDQEQDRWIVKNPRTGEVMGDVPPGGAPFS